MNCGEQRDKIFMSAVREKAAALEKIWGISRRLFCAVVFSLLASPSQVIIFYNRG
jgi:hypothetical protein